MKRDTALVVTSIAAPNEALRELAAGCREHGLAFYLIGDVPSPSDFRLEGCDFYNIERQEQTGLAFAGIAPKRHYARKNIGYLLAMRGGAGVIVETDDDNHPRDEFWSARQRRRHAAVARGAGWVNVYGYFSDSGVWPRGLPLQSVRGPLPAWDTLPVEEVDCPIQQGLADENPDVDAIYRLTLPLPLSFRADRRVALGPASWCPFNSQNTCWWKEAFPLLYLPSHCSFRMTDIWRSFVAQRIVWECGWAVLFHEATVWQERNEHNLMRDFADEIPGYLHNREIGDVLGALTLRAGVENIADNLRFCYEALIRLKVVEASEIFLLEAWLADVRAGREGR